MRYIYVQTNDVIQKCYEIPFEQNIYLFTCWS